MPHDLSLSLPHRSPGLMWCARSGSLYTYPQGTAPCALRQKARLMCPLPSSCSLLSCLCGFLPSTLYPSFTFPFPTLTLRRRTTCRAAPWLCLPACGGALHARVFPWQSRLLEPYVTSGAAIEKQTGAHFLVERRRVRWVPRPAGSWRAPAAQFAGRPGLSGPAFLQRSLPASADASQACGAHARSACVACLLLKAGRAAHSGKAQHAAP